jgi:hypothetical protein
MPSARPPYRPAQGILTVESNSIYWYSIVRTGHRMLRDALHRELGSRNTGQRTGPGFSYPSHQSATTADSGGLMRNGPRGKTLAFPEQRRIDESLSPVRQLAICGHCVTGTRGRSLCRVATGSRGRPRDVERFHSPACYKMFQPATNFGECMGPRFAPSSILKTTWGEKQVLQAAERRARGLNAP